MGELIPIRSARSQHLPAGGSCALDHPARRHGLIRLRRDPDEEGGGLSETALVSLARDAVDLAASSALFDGIAAVSHARGLGVPLAALEQRLAEAHRRPGIRQAHVAVARSTAHAESLLEMLIWVRCQDFGLEPPEQQRIVRGGDGRDYRIDFAWQDGRLLLDADRRPERTAAAAAPGRPERDVVAEEHRREAAIRPACERLVLVSWSAAWNGQGMLRQLLALGLPQRPRCPAGLTF